MKYPLPSLLRRVMLCATACAMLQGGVAAAQDADTIPMVGTRPAMGSMTPQPTTSAVPLAEGSNGAQGDVAELMQLIHNSNLVELRTTYNGSYGASLFFYPQEMTYYAALFQDKHFWRVIKSQDEGRAEAIYDGFVRQTGQLAEVEIRRTQLQAQKAFIERVIALSEDRARRLQADISVARTQQAKVSDYQRQVQGQAVALSVEKEKAQGQLRQLQREVQVLQRQTEAGLPMPR
ncbi:DUF2968 domain-containing protein [Paraburkholderia hayleyella]|uniref:DUF2968 domain-containing protein n=1 Tax=Paraburkholderia hayleyella TaxID=2152889 RepID=UPI0012913348|nr:DUF2968 domain-containing protein [Paraburkholderia hayleyella]